MAEKAPNEAAEEAEGAGGSGESFLDQFLRRLDQTSDQEAGVSPSTTSSSMAVPTTPGEYSSNNPWSFSSALNPDPQHSLLYAPGYSVAAAVSPYSANPLAEFPWLLQEFDHPRPGLDSRLTGTTDHQKLYSSFPQQSEQLPLDQSPVPEGESKRQESIVTGHGSGSSSSKLDAAPVPRFGSSGHFSDAALAQAQIIGGRAINYRAPTSPLLSEATTVGAGGSVTTSAGTSNTSASSGSTSNAGDGDETEKPEPQQQQLEGETSSGHKRKKPEAGGASSDAPDPSKKSVDPTKSKPRKRGGAKRLREPRYAIKTRTDVDVLDDGFKWRKYGQKAVKNSPHPRNYYRCTTPMCPVRKRVERSNEDAGLVITTYEGTHTHQTPGFRTPPGGYFGDRPLGMGGGLFQSPLGPGGANLLPLPPGFDLASLQQANALRNLRGLQPGNPSLPQQQLRQLGLQQDSLLRAQQFLGLQDPAFASVKREPFQFTAQPPDTSRFMQQHRNLLLHQQPPPPGSLLTGRSISDQRPGAALFAGLPGFPISGPASSSNIPRHELEPGSSSRIDQSLQTLVSSSSGRPNFEDRSDQPQSPIHILASAGSLDPRGQQLQRTTTRPGSSSENLQGHAAESSTLGQQQQQQPEGLLQDMVRHGGPKVSKS